eukprot:TRINITY_DN3664_c0_g1_i1.p1 TRINITY_DN3664_c0_g1~~TRINITY_DN3664_c0_g1_i1.p1  ORF type:complete len:804 (-),score=283.41 TRINITY_DN3664_c0_g1_i1:97-2508(-)
MWSSIRRNLGPYQRRVRDPNKQRRNRTHSHHSHTHSNEIMAQPIEEKDFPESFYCPLTHEIFREPMVDKEGNTYEKKAIEQWLQKDPTSPITRTPLALKDLVPNRALKEIIEQALMAKGIKLLDIQDKEEKPVPQKEEVVEAPLDKTQIQLMAVAEPASERNNDTTYNVLVTVLPPQGKERQPVDICCVIDISGSMGEEAAIQDENGKKEQHGLTLLNIVVHAVKTIVAAASDKDRVAVVTYHTTVETLFPLTLMTEANKKTLLAKLDTLTDQDSTNIWGGLETGLEIMRNRSNANERMGSLLLLTDGQPNISPPRGEVEMLVRYKEKYPETACSINTFGFGYNINSELLLKIAIEGGGMYSFIPDASFVGTAFVNCISNFMTTMANNAKLTIEPLNGASIVDKVSGYVELKTTWGSVIDISTIQFGQSKDISFKMNIPTGGKAFLRATLKCQTRSNELVDISIEADSRDGSPEIQSHVNRQLFVETINSAIKEANNGQLAAAVKAVQELSKSISKSATVLSKGIQSDIDGQVVTAFSKADFYKKWGRHYLPSLSRSHLFQQCTNFKDPGLQNYGGKSFEDIRDNIEKLFISLPAPVPKKKAQPPPQTGNYKSTTASSNYNYQPVSMSRYHNRGGGCFDGDCKAKLADGSFTLVKNLKKGDYVATGDRKSAQIVCVVKTICKGGRDLLVMIPNGPTLTPYHPIKIEGQWKFPCDVGQLFDRPCEAIYTFVLNRSHSMIIDGMECVTMGHDFQGPVISHPYFGSQKIVSDLSTLRGWKEGLVQLNQDSFVRDEVNGMITGIRSL